MELLNAGRFHREKTACTVGVQLISEKSKVEFDHSFRSYRNQKFLTSQISRCPECRMRKIK